MKVDAHHHLWDLDAVSYPWLAARGVARFFGDPTPIQRNYPVEEHRRYAAAQGIGASVHVQVGAADGFAEARWVQAMQDGPGAGCFPAAQVAFCDLTAPDRDAQLDRLQTLPSVRGIRQIVGRAPGEDAVTGTGGLLHDPAFIDGLKSLEQRGLSFDLQLLPEQYEAMAGVLSAVPDLKVALCHAGSPHDRSAEGLARWAGALQMLSARPATVCKLSGLGMFDHGWTVERLQPIVTTVLAQFGPERVMLGSNFPVDSLYSDYARLWSALEAMCAGEGLDEVTGATARRFYGLD